MKSMIFASLLMLSTSVFAQVHDVEISCDIGSKLPEVSSLTLNSLNNTITIVYADSKREELAPQAGSLTGVFSTVDFVADIAKGHGTVLTTSPRLGVVAIRHSCYNDPNTYIERCTSQGSGEEREFARVDLNVDHQLYHFVGKTICSRTKL